MKWLLLLTLFCSQSLFASTTDHLAFLFYQNKLTSQDKSFQEYGECGPRPGTPSCLQVICTKLPSYECDTPSEIAGYASACKGNFSGECISAIINTLPSYESDTQSEMIEIAKQCNQIYGSSCMDFIKSKLPSYEYDTKSEIYEMLSNCSGASNEVIECAKYTCGKLPSYECDTKTEIYSILKSCGN